MQEISVFWLRAASALYAIGLFHTIQVAIRKSSTIFRAAFLAFCAGVVLHIVSLVEAARASGSVIPAGFHTSVSLCGLLLALLFLAVYKRYRIESLGTALFPLVFTMAAVASTVAPIGKWASTTERDNWLVVHIALVLLGYSALLLTALAALFYLVQERRLKSKRSVRLLEKLPPLGTLDTLISRSLGFGFILMTLGVVTGATWAVIETGGTSFADPRMSTAVLTWALCLLMLFLRLNWGWRGRKAAVMAVAAVAFSAVTWAAHYVIR